MAELNGGQIAAKQLKAAGIDTIFGVVAGPTIQIMSGAAEEGINVVGCRHEENGAFMAQAALSIENEELAKEKAGLEEKVQALQAELTALKAAQPAEEGEPPA